MAKVYSKALDRSIEVERLIGKIEGSGDGPSMIFTGGIHGNEPSGVFALKNVINQLKSANVDVKGNIYAFSGNLWALERGERYHKRDLNRLWGIDRMELLEQGNLEIKDEDTKQQAEIYGEILKILEEDSGPFYFIDLHTTSSETIPFLTVNDSLLNRKYTQKFPVPMILGIEEYLDGPLLSYINELGYVAFGFEGGQHDDLASIRNHEAFVYLSLVYSGVIDIEAIDFDHYYGVLAKTCIDTQDIFEIYFRHEIQSDEEFKMQPGFVNFQHLSRGQLLAFSNGKPIYATDNNRIFMPLYQSQGDDGYFAIRKIPNLFLNMSAAMRRVGMDRFLVWLPGVKWESKKKDVLLVNKNIARFFTKKFFHLLGYRSQEINENYFRMKNREAASKQKEYSF